MATLDEMYDEATALKESGDLEGAVTKLEEILQADEGHLLAHSALAVHLQRLGRNDDSIAHALKVVELDPKDSFNYTQLSVIYQRCGKIQEAEDAMARAHQLQAGG